MALLSEEKRLKTATSRGYSLVIPVSPPNGTSNRISKNNSTFSQKQGQDEVSAVHFSTISGGNPPLEA